jgi:hypothetical protein
MSNPYDECPASGAGHKFVTESIPSEFITGEEGSEPTVVVQCEYCGINIDETRKILSPEQFDKLLKILDEPANPSQELIDLLKSERNFRYR